MFIGAVEDTSNAVQLTWSDWLSIIAIVVSMVSAYISLRQNKKLHNDSKNFELAEKRKDIYNQLCTYAVVDPQDVELYFQNENLNKNYRKYFDLLKERKDLYDEQNIYKDFLRSDDDSGLYDKLKSLEANYEMDLARDIDSGAEKAFKEFCDKNELTFDPYQHEPSQMKRYNYYELYTKGLELTKTTDKLRKQIKEKMWEYICDSIKEV